MRNKIFVPIFTIAFAIITPSCKKENIFDCFKSTGDVVNERRSIESFTDVVVNDDLNVIFVQDSAFYIEVNAGENLIPLIITEIRDGKLLVENNNTCNWVRDYSIPINVYVHASTLRRIDFYGTGKISSQNTLTPDTIEVNNRNTGDIELNVSAIEVYCKQHVTPGDNTFTGNADYLYLYNASDGFAYCSGLAVNKATVINKGTGYSFVNACDKLDAEITSSGNIYYTANPVIQSTITGSGQLIHQ
ncbi:MAG: DUF2807 domain-containing protein [Bacteroidia bacterium]|nr:DUF2807 domain-containing protein [Bacteroidia bacterium]